MSAALPSTLVLTGPTTGGKSALALAVAHEARRRGSTPVEIVSADSVQVYRGFDIGSSKPSPEERREVPHHLVDIRDPGLGPSARYTAAEFLKDAVAAIGDIQNRGAVPLVVGGTGLYLRALLHGLSGAPPVPENIQRILDAEADREGGLQALRAELERIDPMTAGIVKPGDRRRTLRALGVWRHTGRPLGEWNREHAFAQRPVSAQVWVLAPPRPELQRRIAERTRTMLAKGWTEEVRRLLGSGVPEDAPPFEAIGYRQVLEHVRGRAFMETGELEAEIALRTRQYAKQQLTWWRSKEGVRWIDPLEIPPERLVDEALYGQ